MAETGTHRAYAIISVGGKQYVVREGERLLVDRVAADEGKTFNPAILFLGDGGKGELAPANATVTAKVVDHVLGQKVRIGKYRPKKGYRRHTGFRARLSRIEIESIGGGDQPSATQGQAVPAKQDEPAGLPERYADMTVAEIAEAAETWPLPQLEAALGYERDHAKRKGALAALESAIDAQKEEG